MLDFISFIVYNLNIKGESVISIRFNNEEENVIKNYAKAKGFSIYQLIKETLMKKIEEEYDLEVCKEYLKAKEEGTLVTIPFEEAIKEWDFRIEISEKLNKKIKKTYRNVQKMLYSYIVKNLKDTDNPRNNGKALKGNLKRLWRYRVMDYRLIVDIQDDKLVIIAIDFAHRKEIYK